ncbi:MAG: HAMP domain-containing histidine kinase [Ignavibacteriales bacterium]|nr:HAMP domain-containing histidine kinase [Ignavibacteriales bacterium]
MNRTTRIIFITLFSIVLLPTLFYSVYEITSLDETEEMLTAVYSRQLDAILFSVNQYLLDVSAGWASQIEQDLYWRRYDQLLRSNPSIQSIVISDTSFRKFGIYPFSRFNYRKFFTEQREKVDRLFRYQEVSYRKLEPVIVSDSLIILLFVPSSAPHRIVGIAVNTQRFISDVIGRKLSELAQNDFILAVVHQTDDKIVFSTSSTIPGDFVQQRQLWIFPDHVVKIKLQGVSVQEIADERFKRNLALIILLDAVLIFGAWFVFRTIRREMELVALKSDFVSNVSHELRTPLSLIRMFAETLEMGRVKTNKKKQEYYGIILHETERLTRLINNILNFSRMESRSRKFNFSSTNVNDVVESVLSIYAYQFEQLKFRVETVLDKKLPSIMIDDEAIAEALHNLIDNAMKYSNDEKSIRVETSGDEKSIIITVEDHGVGIPHEHQAKVFEKFYRVSQGLVHTAKGSGLGLAIVQHIVHSHGGTISLKSEPHRGTTFIMQLPISRM